MVSAILTDKFNKMDNTQKARELINKHLYLHGGDGLGISDGDVYRAVLDAVCEALTIPVVVGRSEQLKALEDLKQWCFETCQPFEEERLHDILKRL